MNIALLSQYYKPEMGAPQNRLHEMISGLTRLGAKTCVVTAMPNYPTGKIFNGYKGKFSVTESLEGVDIKRFWLYASNSKRSFPRIINMLSFSFTSLFSFRYLRKRKIDILIVESPPLTLGITGYLLSRMLGAKLVLNVSDLWPLSAKELGAISEGFLYSALERTERFLYRKSVLTLGQSQEIVDYIKEHEAQEVYLFRNGVDPSRFKKIEETERSKDSFSIVYAGLLGVAQGILEICQTINFKELGARFEIYGAGAEQTEIEKCLKEHPTNGITYHGVINSNQIPSVLSKANATLVPLVKNIFGAVPSKIYESMAAGVPILFSGTGEGAKIVIDYNIGIVSKPKEIEELKSNILMMVSNPTLTEQMRQRCLSAAENSFNRPKQVKQLYEKLTSITV